MDTNSVTLTGRVSAAAETRTLPSGDEVASFRLVVDRPPRSRRHSSVRIDTFECAAWTARLRRAAVALAPGDVVVVTGQLRRRFSRAGGRPTSWVSVEVDSITRDTSVRSSP